MVDDDISLSCFINKFSSQLAHTLINSTGLEVKDYINL
jgi:hypothetical protein